MTTDVASLKEAVAVAKAKLEAGVVEMESAETNLEVQLEVQARHRQAVEDARMRARNEAKMRAFRSAKQTQEKANALAKITAEKMEMHVRAMDATQKWAREQKAEQETAHKLKAK